MDLAAFRAQVRADLAEGMAAFADAQGHVNVHDQDVRHAFETRLCRAGYGGLGWPQAYGGQALSPAEIAVYHEEHARIGAPQGVNTIGHGIVGPTLLLFGSDDQKACYLPAIARNAEIWCQGYSEPGAGSDLAALSTRARREADHYIVTGQKIWTSWAHIANFCFLLVRTASDGPKHKGITVLLADMRLPGITVRPIRQASGEQEFNEVFFTDVRIPVSQRVGDENDGWRLAMAAASYERGTYFIPRLVRMEAELRDLAALSREVWRGGRPLADDGAFRARLARSQVDVFALKELAARMLVAAERHAAPGPEASYIKLVWSESHQRLLDLAMDVLGPEAALGPQDLAATRRRLWQRDHLWSRAETILAGTSEVQRNIVAERLLQLPR